MAIGIGSSKEFLVQSPPSGGIDVLHKAAQQLQTADKNIEHTGKLRQLSSSVEPEKQMDGLTYLRQNVMSVLAKMKRKYPKIKLENLHPVDLQKEALGRFHPKMNSAEYAAVRHFHRLINESGPTRDYLFQNWPEIVLGAKDVSDGLGGKFSEAFKKKPVQTAVMIGAGAIGLYLGFKLIQKLWESDKKDKAAGKQTKKSWLGKKIVVPLAAFLIGMLGGKKALASFLETMKLEQLQKLKKKVANMKGVPKKVRDQINQELAKKAPGAKKKLNELRESVGVTAKKGKEALKSPEVQFEAARSLFRSFNFFNAREFGEYSYSIEQVLRKLGSTQASKLVVLAEKYSTKKEIPLNDFPINNVGNLNPRVLFLIAKGVRDIYKLIYKNKPSTETIQQLFIKALNDPTLKLSHSFQEQARNNIKNGRLDFSRFNFSGVQNVLKTKLEQFRNRKNKELGIPENLHPSEKKALSLIQARFLLKAHMSGNAAEALDVAIAGLPDQQKQSITPKVKELAIGFFERIKNDISQLLPKIHQKLDIGKKHGLEPVLQNNLILKNLKFSDALKLLIMSEGINWNEDSKKGHWMKDLTLIYVVLSCLDKSSRHAYEGQLATAFAMSDSSLPSLERLRPYYGKLQSIISSVLVAKGEKYLRMAAQFRDSKVDLSKPYIAIPSSGLKGGIEMATDTLAAIVAAAGISPKNFSNVNTARDFFDLIAKKGGKVVYPTNKEGGIKGGAMVAIYVGKKWFWTKPTGSMAKAAGFLAEIKPFKAAEQLVYGASTFMVIGGAAGLIKGKGLARITSAASGAWKGAKYFYFSPYYIVRGTVRGVRGAASLGLGTKELVKRPFRAVGDIARWGSETIALRQMPWNRSVNNMARYASFLNNHYYKSTLVGMTEARKLTEFWTNPKLAFSRLGDAFHTRMAYRNASLFARSYNDFFGWGNKLRVSISQITSNDVNHYAEVAERFNSALKKFNADKTFAQRLENLAKTAKNPDAIKSGLEHILKDLGFYPEEIGQLKNIINSKGDVRHLIRRFAYGADALIKFEKLDDAAKTLSSTSKAADTLSDTAKTAKAADTAIDSSKALEQISKIGSQIQDAEKSLIRIQQRVASAQRKLASLRASGRSADKISKAEDALSLLKKAENAAQDSIAQLKRLFDLHNKLRHAKDSVEMVDLAKDLLKVQQSAKQAAENAAKAAEAIGEMGTWAKIGRYIGIGGSGLGAAVGLYYFGSGMYEAATTRVKGRAGMELAHGGMWGVAAAADIAALAVLLKGSAAGSVATGVSYAALPLVPITAAGTIMYETSKERNFTQHEWAQKYSYQNLIHQFFSTAHVAGSVTAGEALVEGFKSVVGGYEKANKTAIQYKRKTMNKIFKVLIASQNNRALTNTLISKKPGEVKDKEIDAQINKSYSKYHQAYFDNLSGDQTPHLSNYAEAQKMIVDAQLFHEVMTLRENLKKRGVKSYKIGATDLMKPKYEITGTKAKPVLNKSFSPRILVEYYKDHQLKKLNQIPVPNFVQNLDKMDINYMLHLYVQINILAQSKDQSKISAQLGRQMMAYIGVVRQYLTCKRGININMAARNPVFYNQRMSLDDIQKHLVSFGASENAAYFKYEKLNAEKNPAVYALYRLAQYFGYSGYAKEKDLKLFFNEKKASYQGVYWNGSEWVVQEAGMELDDKMGSKLDESLIKKISKRLRENAGDVLEHRRDSVFASGFDYSEQVKNMADILDKGYQDGVKKVAELNKPTPKSSKPQFIDSATS